MVPVEGAPVDKPVEFGWNDRQIPFITARSDRDLAVGLGVVHAHLRRAQMEILRRVSQGRLAEMVGPAGIALDRALRGLDIGRAVPATDRILPPRTRDWLEGFVAGVNHCVAAPRHAPLECRVLALEPEPWTVADVLRLGRLLSADVNWPLLFRMLGLQGGPEWAGLWQDQPARGEHRPLRPARGRAGGGLQAGGDRGGARGQPRHLHLSGHAIRAGAGRCGADGRTAPRLPLGWPRRHGRDDGDAAPERGAEPGRGDGGHGRPGHPRAMENRTMTNSDMRPGLKLQGVETGQEAGREGHLRLLTDAGRINCRLHRASFGDAAVLWVFGAGGGLGGPAGGLYTRLGHLLRGQGILSLELAYRHPGRLGDCVQDVLLGLAWLAGEGRRRVVLVGHSFGGAVVIKAGAASQAVIAVAALSSQTQGTEAVPSLSPKPLLLVHGSADEILPDICSRDIYGRAHQPKDLILYPGCKHGLDQCRDALDRDLLA